MSNRKFQINPRRAAARAQSSVSNRRRDVEERITVREEREYHSQPTYSDRAYRVARRVVYEELLA